MEQRYGLMQQASDQPVIPIQYVEAARWNEYLASLSSFERQWLSSLHLSLKSLQVCCVPDESGNLRRVVVLYTPQDDFWSMGDLSRRLPPEYGYSIQSTVFNRNEWVLAWGLGAYRFNRYKKSEKSLAYLHCPYLEPSVGDAIETLCWVRDLINTPAQDMTPEHLYDAALTLTKYDSVQVTQIVGDDLLTQGYPCIHAVGRGSIHAPRLIELRFGKPEHPLWTVVGKGVCFDSGGYDIKNSSGMLLMKKDMGGAAHALGLARWVIQRQLPIRLRVLIPAVENLVSGNAYKPGDILNSRKGLTIEIGDTDAEGRLVMADALAAACEERPEFLLDFSTLTGAARIAVGTEIAAYFCNHEPTVEALESASIQEKDPIWRLPLYTPYRKLLNSLYADLNNSGTTSYAAAITAALFLREFIDDSVPWVHFDMMAWNVRAMPGRPEGGEAMGLRAVWAFLEKKMGQS